MFNRLRDRILANGQEESYLPQSVQEADPNTNHDANSSKTWETTVTRIPSWPEEAQTLKQHTWVTYLYSAGDLILVILPVYFILLGVAVATLNGSPTKNNEFGQKVEAAIQLGPTIFPIVFAAICGRSMKMIARFLAERGAKLSATILETLSSRGRRVPVDISIPILCPCGPIICAQTLELLMASQSVWGTIESQLLMRRLTLVGVNLLFLWALSPLGGQASLRLLEKTTKSDYASKDLRYQSTGPGAVGWAMQGTYVENSGLPQVNPIFASAILSPKELKAATEDLWGNVKIPAIESLDVSLAGRDGWINVPSNGMTAENYTSLVGIPVIGRSLDQDADFSLETSYLKTECEPFQQTHLAEDDYAGLEKLLPGHTLKNISKANNPWATSTFVLQSFLPNENLKNDVPRLDAFFGFLDDSRLERPIEKRKFTYASGFYANKSFAVNIANCSISQVHTETAVRCRNSRCSGARTRRSQSDKRPEEITALEHTLIEGELFKSFPNAARPTKGSAIGELFIFNTTSMPLVSPMEYYTDNRGWVDVSKLSPETFSRRLGLLLNTYFQLSLAPNAYMGTLPSNNMSLYGPDTLPVSDINLWLPSNLSTTNTTYDNWYLEFSRTIFNSGMPFVTATTNATMTSTEEIYACNFAWLALLLTAAGILFITGTSSLLLKHKTLAPEMFGFVASMTYENPHVRIPQGGSTLDAMERARLLKDVDVYIGDVHGDKAVGHIAIAAGVPMRRLERSRMYC